MTEFSQEHFEAFCRGVADKHQCASSTGEAVPKCWVSLSRMTDFRCACVSIPTSQLADFLNDFGQKTVETEIPDVQFWLQQRENKTKQVFTRIEGAIIDGDEKMPDDLGSLLALGNPLPTLHWETMHGHKFAYAFDQNVLPEEFEIFAMQITLSIPGGDPSSWHVNQGQLLPTCLKSTPDGVVPVKFQAVQSNSVPFRFAEYKSHLPTRISSMLGGSRTLSTEQRTQIEEYLTGIGLSPPEDVGSILYPACLKNLDHGKKCCYVNRRDDGSIDATCLAGHEGEDQQHWNEHDIYELATGLRVPKSKIDLVRHIPGTWAGLAFLQHHLSNCLAGEKRDLATHRGHQCCPH